METGQRGLVSNLKVDSTFSDVVDLLAKELRTENLPLSTAAHLSARFTYVSPAGTILDNKGDVWGHVVDGGYFENSGAATAIELMRSMQKVITSVEKDRTRKLPLMFILIRNDPNELRISRPIPPITVSLHPR